MWSKFKIRTKITLVSTLILLIISISFTIAAIEAFKYLFINPIQTIIIQGDAPDNIIPLPNDLGNEVIFDLENTEQVIIETNKNFTIVIIVIIILVVIVNIIGILLIYYATKRLLSPLESFTKHIKSIDSNNINKQIKLPNKNDEVFDLSNAFNKMILNLDES
ncbi:MAG: HAMP domain-containing protein, partial [Bacilli bacterium]